MEGIILNPGATGSIAPELITQNAGSAENLVMSQKAVTDYVDQKAGIAREALTQSAGQSADLIMSQQAVTKLVNDSAGPDSDIAVSVQTVMQKVETLEQAGSVLSPMRARPVQLIAVKRNPYGDSVSPKWSDYFDINCVEITGTQYARNLGEYEITATPLSDCAWEDGSTGPRTFKWYIVEDIIPSVPKQTDQYYQAFKWEHGEEQGWDIFSETGVDGKYGPNVIKTQLSQTGNAPRVQNIKWELQNPEGEIHYVWWDGTIAPKVGTWQIDVYTIPKLPEQIAPVVWSGGSSANGTPFSDFLDCWEHIADSSGYMDTFRPEHAGIQEVGLRPIDVGDARWWDGTKEIKYITVTVDKVVVSAVPQLLSEFGPPSSAYGDKIPEFDIFTFGSRGAVQLGDKYTDCVLLPYFDGKQPLHSTFIYSGGTHTIEWRLTSPVDEEWWDGTTEPKTVTVTIPKYVIPAVPKQVGKFSGAMFSGGSAFDIFYAGTLPYNAQIDGKWTNLVLNGWLGDKSVASYDHWDPGTYEIEWRITNPDNAEWWDGTTEPKTSTLVVTDA